MCGIVGFLAKTRELQQSLGAHVTPMLNCMGTRGPDSAGFAVFTEPVAADHRRFSVFSYDRSFDWQTFQNAFRKHSSDKADGNGNGNGGGDFEFAAVIGRFDSASRVARPDVFAQFACPQHSALLRIAGTTQHAESASRSSSRLLLLTVYSADSLFLTCLN